MKQLLHVQNIILGAVDDDGDYAGDGADDNYDADANCDSGDDDNYAYFVVNDDVYDAD